MRMYGDLGGFTFNLAIVCYCLGWCPIMTPAVLTIMIGRRHVFWEGANSSFQEGYCRSLVEKHLY